MALSFWFLLDQLGWEKNLVVLEWGGGGQEEGGGDEDLRIS